MASVNIVVPALKRDEFSGGILCIFEYAKGLTALGHHVNIIPLLPSPEPRWVRGEYGRLVRCVRERGSAAAEASPRLRSKAKGWFREQTANFVTRIARTLPHEVQHGFQLRNVRRSIPQADVTIATSFDTARAVYLYGTGARFYFVQHYEPLLAQDTTDPKWAEHEALASYNLGLKTIANSSWLQRTLRERLGVQSALCPNAIDHVVFVGEPRVRKLTDEVRVISYGGNHARWKGMLEMAEAVRRVRAEMPGLRIRWQVFGNSILPPRNQIADYEPLGFLQPPHLAEAYRQADLLLSASWYESFPLFPLEAMACGLPVITTQPGTEEYAIQGETAEIVEPRNVESIARGLKTLIENAEYRRRLATNGRSKALQFSWPRSVARMQQLLFG